MDCGWQNLEGAANNRFECLKSLASDPDCMGRAAPPLASSMRDVLSPFAMMISWQLTSAILPTPDCALHDTSARIGRSSEKKNIHFVTNLFYYSVASRLPCNSDNLIVACATLAVYIPSGNSSECCQH